MRRTVWCAGAAIFLFLFTLASSAEDTVDSKAIDNANARLVELQKAGDAAGMGRMYTDDAVLLPADGTRIEGRDDIEAFWAKVLSGGIKDVRLTTENLVPLGEDLVYEIGSYTTT